MIYDIPTLQAWTMVQLLNTQNHEQYTFFPFNNNFHHSQYIAHQLVAWDFHRRNGSATDNIASLRRWDSLTSFFSSGCAESDFF